MANVKLIFGGSEESNCSEITIECYVNNKNGLYISIQDHEVNQCYSSAHIVLDKSTAIKLSKELRKQISLMED
jgi:hypothetical protein